MARVRHNGIEEFTAMSPASMIEGYHGGKGSSDQERLECLCKNCATLFSYVNAHDSQMHSLCNRLREIEKALGIHGRTG